MEDTLGVVIPDPKTDYHGHLNYGKIYVWLLILFAVSLTSAFLFSHVAAIATVFVIAIIQAGLIARNFMHLKFEPVLIWIIAIAAVFCLVMFLYGMYIDITPVTREIAK
jgi:cytochrome c oxidase subunit IV